VNIYTSFERYIRRESDGACVPKDPANRDYQAALESGTIVTAPAADPIPARIAAAWSAADALAESAIDHNSREQFIVWLIDPSSSVARKQAIGACLTWMSQVWGTYAATKAQIIAGNDARFSFSTACPHTFWEVAQL
jgi:hypothetical protein